MASQEKNSESGFPTSPQVLRKNRSKSPGPSRHPLFNVPLPPQTFSLSLSLRVLSISFSILTARYFCLLILFHFATANLFAPPSSFFSLSIVFEISHSRPGQQSSRIRPPWQTSVKVSFRSSPNHPASCIDLSFWEIHRRKREGER